MRIFAIIGGVESRHAYSRRKPRIIARLGWPSAIRSSARTGGCDSIPKAERVERRESNPPRVRAIQVSNPPAPTNYASKPTFGLDAKMGAGSSQPGCYGICTEIGAEWWTLKAEPALTRWGEQPPQLAKTQ